MPGTHFSTWGWMIDAGWGRCEFRCKASGLRGRNFCNKKVVPQTEVLQLTAGGMGQ